MEDPLPEDLVVCENSSGALIKPDVVALERVLVNGWSVVRVGEDGDKGAGVVVTVEIPAAADRRPENGKFLF